MANLVVSSECILQVNEEFFLLIDFDTPIDRLVVLSITVAEARALLNSGVQRCTVVSNVPIGGNVELQCTLVVGNQAFIIFEVENNRCDRIVVVRSPICTVA